METPQMRRKSHEQDRRRSRSSRQRTHTRPSTDRDSVDASDAESHHHHERSPRRRSCWARRGGGRRALQVAGACVMGGGGAAALLVWQSQAPTGVVLAVPGVHRAGGRELGPWANEMGINDGGDGWGGGIVTPSAGAQSHLLDCNHIPGWFRGHAMYAAAVETIRSLPPPVVAVELGAYLGQSSCWMSWLVADDARVRFHVVDSWGTAPPALLAHLDADADDGASARPTQPQDPLRKDAQLPQGMQQREDGVGVGIGGGGGGVGGGGVGGGGGSGGGGGAALGILGGAAGYQKAATAAAAAVARGGGDDAFLEGGGGGGWTRVETLRLAQAWTRPSDDLVDKRHDPRDETVRHLMDEGGMVAVHGKGDYLLAWAHYVKTYGHWPSVRTVVHGASIDARDVVDRYANRSVSFVFVDRCRRGRRTAFSLWWPKIRAGGLLCGDDAGYGVVQQRLRTAFRGSHATVTWHPNSYWCVRRPAPTARASSSSERLADHSV